MYFDQVHKVELRCIKGGYQAEAVDWIPREEYEKVKRDCDRWYQLWLEECRKRK